MVWFLRQVMESSDVNGDAEGPTSLRKGLRRNYCSIQGHKKRINLNLVYNEMPFKLIHLACALELLATPSDSNPIHCASALLCTRGG